MVEWLQNIGRIMPLYYAADALNGVMYKGYAFRDIAVNLVVLACFALVFIILNIISLKKIPILIMHLEEFYHIPGRALFYRITKNTPSFS